MWADFNKKYFNQTKEESFVESDFPQKPTTSWVIRTYNEEKWIGTVLNALFLQSRLDFEIILIDSGSIDNTLEITKQFPIRKMIKVSKKEFNYSKALNIGIEASWGKYIGIISGHSVPVSRDWYAMAIKNFKDKKLAAVTGRYNALPDGAPSEKLGDLYWNPSNAKKEHNCKWMTNTNAIIRKDLWREYRFDESLPQCEDYDWALEMLSRGYDIVKDPNFNVYHSHGGIGRPVYQKRVDEWKEICARIDKKVRPTK